MNNFSKKIFFLKKSLYQHSFGMCARLRVPYTELKNKYYHFIMRNLVSVCDDAYKEVQFKNNQYIDSQNTHHVWVMWWQGIEEAPKVVKSNINIMQKIFGNDLKIISKDNFMNYVDINPLLKSKFKYGIILQQQWADIIRVNLLKRYGGLWIDSTVVLSNEICEYPKLFDRSFVSICSSEDNEISVSHENWATWFIGGKSNTPIFEFLSIFFVKYFNCFDFNLDYFLLDYAISYFYKKNKDFREEIEAQKREWHALYFYNNLYNPISEVNLNKFNNDLGYCIQKVTYKINEKKVTPDCLFSHIVNDDLKDR